MPPAANVRTRGSTRGMFIERLYIAVPISPRRTFGCGVSSYLTLTTSSTIRTLRPRIGAAVRLMTTLRATATTRPQRVIRPHRRPSVGYRKLLLTAKHGKEQARVHFALADAAAVRVPCDNRREPEQVRLAAY